MKEILVALLQRARQCDFARTRDEPFEEHIQTLEALLRGAWESMDIASKRRFLSSEQVRRAATVTDGDDSTESQPGSIQGKFKRSLEIELLETEVLLQKAGFTFEEGTPAKTHRFRAPRDLNLSLQPLDHVARVDAVMEGFRALQQATSRDRI